MSLFHMDFEFSYGLLQPYTTLPSITGIVLLISISLYGLYRGKYKVLSFAVIVVSWWAPPGVKRYTVRNNI